MLLKDEKDVRDELEMESIESSEVADILEKHYKCAVKPASVRRGEAGLGVAVFLAEKQGVKIETMIKRGHAAETIVTIAKEENVDMICQGRECGHDCHWITWTKRFR